MFSDDCLIRRLGHPSSVYISLFLCLVAALHTICIRYQILEFLMFSYCFPFHDALYGALKKCMDSPWYAPKGSAWLVLQNIMWVIVLKVSEKGLQILAPFLLGIFQIICHLKMKYNCKSFTFLGSLISYRLLNNE